eukprot:scaffold54349_cov68-Phaeocystis_antarctica.AAC.6
MILLIACTHRYCDAASPWLRAGSTEPSYLTDSDHGSPDMDRLSCSCSLQGGCRGTEAAPRARASRLSMCHEPHCKARGRRTGKAKCNAFWQKALHCRSPTSPMRSRRARRWLACSTRT